MLRSLAEAYEANGDGPTATETWRAAADILDALGHPDAEKVRARARRIEP